MPTSAACADPLQRNEPDSPRRPRGLHVLPSAQDAAPSPPGPDVLTPREAEVMELLQSGKSNAEIAQELHIGIETVRSHARRIYRKLGVRTRRELLARR